MKQVPRRQAIRAWHFLHEGDKLRTGEVAPADGKWLTFPGKPRICERGLHASRDPFDALSHAPGPVLCLVDCAGVVDENEDKLVCTERRIVARMDATPLLRHFARQQALSVVHLWEPTGIVLDWLAGDEAARSAARSAAGSAAWSAAESAARSAARSAAGSAAWAAWSAAESAARSAAESAARSAARAEFKTLVGDAFADWL